jgi:hypothetical protein
MKLNLVTLLESYQKALDERETPDVHTMYLAGKVDAIQDLVSLGFTEAESK